MDIQIKALDAALTHEERERDKLALEKAMYQQQLGKLRDTVAGALLHAVPMTGGWFLPNEAKWILESVACDDQP